MKPNNDADSDAEKDKKLGDAKIRAAKPREKAYKIRAEHGLYLEVLPTGGKSWRWKYRFDGKEKRMTFGLYPEVTLKEARDRTFDARARLRQGVEPADCPTVIN